jgi:WD40 repeat protein
MKRFPEKGHPMIAGRQGRLLALVAVAAFPALGVLSLPAAERPAAAGPVVKFAGIFAPVTGIAFSPDGKTIAYSDQVQVFLRNLSPGGKVSKASADEYTAAACCAMALSPDGKRLASVYLDLTTEELHSVRLWKVSATNELRDATTLPVSKEKRLCPYPCSLAYLVFSPDGRMLATRHPGDETIIWEVATGKERLRLPTHGLAVAFGPDGRTLIAVSRDGYVQHWDLATKKCVTPDGGTGRKDFVFVEIATASADGRTVALTDGYSVVLKDTRSGKTLRRFDGRDARKEMPSLSPDGKTLAVGGVLYDSATGEERTRFDDGLRAVFSPHGKSVAVVEPAGEDEESVSIWDTDKLSRAGGRKSRPDPLAGRLQIKLTSAKDTYELDLGGKTAEQFARLVDLQSGKPLPPAPAVDLSVTFRNNSDKTLTFQCRPRVDVYLAGDGAMNHPVSRELMEKAISGGKLPDALKTVTLAPRETYSVPVKSLEGFAGRCSYWLLPGAYTLRASCSVAVEDIRGRVRGFSFRQVATPPLLVNVTPGKK